MNKIILLILLTLAIDSLGRDLVAQEHTDVNSSHQSNATIVKRIELPDKLDEAWNKLFSVFSFSNDGTRVAYIPESNSELRLWDLSTNEDRQLIAVASQDTEGQVLYSAAVFSRKGDRVAILQRSKVGSEIKIVATDGGDARAIYRSSDLKLIPADWSFDEKYVVALAGRTDASNTVLLIPTDGGELRQFDSAAWKGIDHVRCSPAEDLIAYTRSLDGRPAVFLFSLATRREIRIAPSEYSDLQPTWSTNGRHLLFRSNRSDGSWEVWSQRITNGTPDGEPLSVHNINRDAVLFRVLGDGRLLYANTNTTVVPEIYQTPMDPDRGTTIGKPTRLGVGSARDGFPSPDGHQIAYLSFETETGRGLGLRIYSPEKGETQDISTDIRNPFPFGWYPDGKSLLVGGYTPAEERGIHRLQLATGQSETLFTGPGVRNARLTLDGRNIAFVMPFDAEPQNITALYRLKLPSDGRPTVLRYQEKESSADPSWSPNGRYVAFVGEYTTEPVSRILVIPADGGGVRELIRHRFEYGGDRRIRFTSWSPNGKFIAYAKGVFTSRDEYGLYGTQVWIVPAEGGEAVHLDQCDGYGASHLHWKSDGTALMFGGLGRRSRKLLAANIVLRE